MVGLVGGLDVLNHPPVRPVVVELVGVLNHALEGALGGAHPLDGGDLVLEREDRLDLERAADPRLRLAHAPAAAQILERVDAEPDLQGLAGLLDPCDHGGPVGPGARGGGGGEQQQAEAAAGRFPVDHLHALPEPALGQQAVGLVGRLAGARDAARKVDGDDVPAGVEQRFPHGEEVADRRL